MINNNEIMMEYFNKYAERYSEDLPTDESKQVFVVAAMAVAEQDLKELNAISLPQLMYAGRFVLDEMNLLLCRDDYHTKNPNKLRTTEIYNYAKSYAEKYNIYNPNYIQEVFNSIVEHYGENGVISTSFDKVVIRCCSVKDNFKNEKFSDNSAVVTKVENTKDVSVTNEKQNNGVKEQDNVGSMDIENIK